MPSNYRGPKKNDGKIVDKFRDACPPHKVKDLDALVKQCKGDEAKIQAKITEWWDEPVIEEPQWEAVGKVNKKAPEKSSSRGSGGGDRGSGSRSSDKGGTSGSGRTERRGDRSSHGGGGRDGPRRDGRGGRAGGNGRYGDRDRDRNRGGDRGQKSSASASGSNSVPKKKKESGVPTPVTNVSAPKGAWGSGGQSFAAAAASSSEPKSAPAQAPEPQAPPALSEPEATPVLEPEDEVPVDFGGPSVNMLALEDPTPSGLTSPAAALSPPPVATGNVWGTKGGAHLIQAAKKPVPAPPEVAIEPELEPEAVPEEPEPLVVEEPETELEQTLVKESSFNVSLDNVLPPSVNGANINASGWEPVLDTTDSTSQQQLEPSPVGPISADPIMPEPEPEPISLPKAVAPAAPGPAGGVKPSSVLNMGHWETGEDDDLDFGFGSFGAPENDTEVTTTATNSSNGASQPPSAGPGASPARPPPGLSMPPMPANAMLVHELEGKLDNTTLGPKVDTNNTEKTTAQSSQPQFDAVNQLTSQMGNPPGMSQYGGMGMYNIPPVPGPNALGSMPPSQFPLGGAANSNQQQSNAQQSDSRPGNPPSQLNQATGQQQQQGYGMQPNPTSASTNTSAPGTDNAPNTTAGAPGSGNAPNMPPGMPSSMQYPNPAYMYAAQPGQFNQMGHPAYGMQAAAYGYGQQFAPQGGHQFGGYNQPGLMGQGGGGYGAPSHYDDQRGGRGGNSGNNMRDNHQGGGGYNKGGGRGYRGNRNNHHNNNHGSGYGNNYGQSNPNVGGYGASPYGNMGGYGGYGNPGGPSGMDHYGMQQQQQQQQQQQGGGAYGGFSHQDDKKQGGGFQQQSHLHQQPLGLHGTSTDTGTAGGASAGGWPGSRQNWGGNWQQEN